MADAADDDGRYDTLVSLQFSVTTHFFLAPMLRDGMFSALRKLKMFRLLWSHRRTERFYAL